MKRIIAIFVLMAAGAGAQVVPYAPISIYGGGGSSANGITGTLVSGQVAVATGTNSIGGDANFTSDTSGNVVVNSLQSGGLATGATFDTTATTYGFRTTLSPGTITAASEFDYNAAFTNAQVDVAGIFAINDTGTASGGSDPHIVGLLGYAQDNAGSSIPLTGVEARIDRLGFAATDTGSALRALGNYAGTTFTGRVMNVVSAQAEIYTTTIGGSPLAQGRTVAFNAIAPTGGDPTLSFALVGGAGMQVATSGMNTIADPTNANRVTISDDATNAVILSSGGNLELGTSSGSGYVDINAGLGLEIPAMSTAGIQTNNASGQFASLSNASSPSSVLEGLLGSGWSNSSSLVLLANGTWGAAPAGTAGNPSATIGLTAVNGSATTYMRSDGAPALGVAITPSWTGAHTWTTTALGTTTSPFITLVNTTAALTGAQQVSPALVWQGNGFATGGASETVAFRAFVLPVQAATPTATWQLQQSINGSAFANVLTVTSASALTSGAITCTSITGTSNWSTSGTIGTSNTGGNAINLTGIGGSISIKGGSNARSGTVTLTSGAGTISTTAVTAKSCLHMSPAPGSVSGTVLGAPYATAATVGTGYTIAAGSGDNSVYNWWISEVNN
jgi:hypothetical protein